MAAHLGTRPPLICICPDGHTPPIRWPSQSYLPPWLWWPFRHCNMNRTCLQLSWHPPPLFSKTGTDLRPQSFVNSRYQLAPNTASRWCKYLPPGASYSNLHWGEGWHWCLVPCLVSQTVSSPVAILSTLVAMRSTLQAVFCCVSFAFAPVACYTGVRATFAGRCGTTTGWAHRRNHVLVWVFSCRQYPALASRSPIVIALISGDCWSLIEMVLGNPVTKASLVSFSISVPSNPANPISCLILFVNTSMRSLAHLTMVSFLYTANALSVKASFSRASISSISLWLASSISM